MLLTALRRGKALYSECEKIFALYGDWGTEYFVNFASRWSIKTFLKLGNLVSCLFYAKLNLKKIVKI